MSGAALEGHVEAYLEALVARDPGRLELAAGARFTENGQAIPLGDGLWGTATPEPRPCRAVCVADPARGQVGFFGTVAEHGVPCLLALRLRVDATGAVAEAEQLVCRPRHSLFDLFDADGMSPERAHFLEPLAEADRPDRRTLVAVADAYFDGIQANDGGAIPVTDACVRFENGVQSVRRPSAEGGFGGGRMGVAEQISSGMFRYIGAIRDRRYPVMDEERGLVMAVGIFDHPGKLTAVEVAGVGTVELPEFAKRPSSALIFELFKVASGQIVAIEALLDFFPFGTTPGW